MRQDSETRAGRVLELQHSAASAKRSRNKDAEIDALLAIGDLQIDDDSRSALWHFRLAEKIIRAAKRIDRLDEAVGGQGKAFRRQKSFDDAISCYLLAEHAAKTAGKRLAQARWVLRRASAFRTTDRLTEAIAAVNEAEDLLRPQAGDESARSGVMGRINFFDPEAIGMLAELEGQIGLNLVNAGDEQGGEDHYRSALTFALNAEDWSAVSTWATNVGNACRRRRAYGEAVDNYEKAVAASVEIGEAKGVVNAATAFAACMAQAFRHEEGGDRLRAIAASAGDGRATLALLNQALLLYDEGICVGKAIEAADDIESAAAVLPVREDFLDEVRSIRSKMGRWSSMRPAQADGPFPLDLYFVEYMVRAEKSGRVEPALQAAHLACDVRLGLALAGDKEWKRLTGGDILASAGLDLRVVFDTLRMLLVGERPDEAIDLLQRFKAASFCVPTLLRLQSSGSARGPAADYLRAARELRDSVDALAGPAAPDFVRRTNAVRRAGERMRDAGESLREVDPILMARLGNPVRRDELLDALPFASGVGIVDFVVGRDETLGVALQRGMSGVTATPFITPSFNATHARRLFELYQESNLPKQLGGAHTEALMEMAQILHDNLFCGLARRLSEVGVTQMILIPDLLTRSLPLHLSFACGKEFTIPGVDVQDARFLCEVMPVEYAPCIQAVAASQVYVRPKAISRIAAFTDPIGDLPSARASVQEFAARASDPTVFRHVSGSAMTKLAVEHELPEADVVIFGTHGVFTPERLEDTHLVLNDDRWTVADMLRMPELQKRALLLLMACEVGAVAATPNDRDAWGIPGALVASGASAVLANLWPVEDVTSTILLERFLTHLGHRGFRPAAALFRAVRDLRRMERAEAVEYCARQLERLKANGAPKKVLLNARSMLEWAQDTDAEHPFAHPFFWGATAIVGSGWHLPATAVVGPPEIAIDNLLKLTEAEALAGQFKPRDALAVAQEVAARSDGVFRARAYAVMAWALLQSAHLSTVHRVRRKAARLLTHAERIAFNEDEPALRDRVRRLQAQMEADHVADQNR